MQNLMLIRLAPVSNPKNEKAKSLYAFLFWDQFNQIKVLFSFPDHFGQMGNSFEVSMKQSN